MRLIVAALAAVLGPVSVASAAPYDLDRDGRPEAVVGAPGWSPGGASNAGAVFVLRIAGGGLSRRPEVLMEGAGGLSGVPEGDDALGVSTASADFNHDGFADLAIAVPGDRVTLVLPGSRSGLQTARGQTLDDAGRLVAGDLDGDGHGDLVVGDVAASPRGDYGSGAIRVYRGGRRGVNPATRRTLSRPHRSDVDFGTALGVGDLDGNGHLDIVEAAPGLTDASDGEEQPGHLSLCAGSPSGPKRCRAVGRPIPGGPVTLAVADMDRDGYDDVIGGRPVDSYVVENEPSGAVNVWRGSAGGPRRRPLRLSQRSPGVPGRGKPGDSFGAAVAVADLDGDGMGDLAVGAPGERRSRGQVTIVRGTRRGFARSGAVTLRQGQRGVPGQPRPGDGFGAAVAVLRAGSAARPMLLVGAPGEPSITVMRTRRGGPPRPLQLLTPSSLGLEVPPEPPDALGGFGSRFGRPFAS